MNERLAYIHELTDEVGYEMQDSGYAYWSSYDQCWRTKKGPNLAGIIAAVLRAQSRIEVDAVKEA